MAEWLTLLTADDEGEAPPGSGPDQLRRMQGGPWFQTQLELSLFIGFVSLLTFTILRTRWKVLYAPRTLMKGFSPHEVHDRDTYFGWILPTLRTSEFTVLQLVGLDAAVLLSFFKMAFYFFLTASVLGCTVLMPINWRENGTLEGIDPPNRDDKTFDDGTSMFAGSTLYLTSHLVATYTFSIIALIMLHRTYARFVHTRQLFSLDHGHSVPARTVLISKLPPHLRTERALAAYWEDMGEHMTVESVSVGRQVGSLADRLADRTAKLRKLEEAWCSYIGNPPNARLTGYRRDDEVARILGRDPPPSAKPSPDPNIPLIDHPTEGEAANGHADTEALLEDGKAASSIGGKKRPTMRVGWKWRKVDQLDYLAEAYREADQAVRARRRGRFHPTELAFVTFESMASAQIASQVIHYPQPEALETVLAPEPRDIYWANLALGETSVTIRRLVTVVAMLLLLLFWGVPISYLARLLNYDSIKKAVPWLDRAIEKSPRLRALVQNSLPSLALIGFNALLPFFLEWLCIFQGHRARSWIEYSILKKYFLFLLINVLFIFVAVSTWALARELADQPMKLFEKLATSLPAARIFFISYVMLQSLAVMPLQLVQLAVILPRFFFRIFFTRTPRDHAELNAPPTLNLGVVYPQAILIFIIGLTYSVISPLILIFATIYFGFGYLIYKYKLLFVYYRTYESRGQAWPISFTRIALGLVIFQVFMTSLFTLRMAYALTSTMVPLILGTVWTCYRMHDSFSGLSHRTNLSQAAEVQSSATTGPRDIERLHKGYPVTRSQMNLNRARYGASDDLDTIYCVAKDPRTDYSQSPMSDAFPGVLNTGRRRYAHPAIFGRLPTPWLPAPLPEAHDGLGEAAEVTTTEAIVLDLRQKWRNVRARASHALQGGHHAAGVEGGGGDDDATRAWRGEVDETRRSLAGREVDDDLGVESVDEVEGEALHHDDDDDDEDEDETDEEGAEEGTSSTSSQYRPFVPHPERRRSGFPPASSGSRRVSRVGTVPEEQ